MKTVGIIGLGKMGLNIAIRLKNAGFNIIGYDTNEQSQQYAQTVGITIAKSIKSLAHNARIIWLMLPAGEIIDTVIQDLLPLLQKNDIIIDGGNSFYKDSIKRNNLLTQYDINFIDCGTSGGLAGLENGYSLMLGGDTNSIAKIQDIFKAVATINGVEHVGPSGAGHYVKMVHNGIEYALLQAYAEGFDLLKHGHYPNLNLEKIASVWLHGSVIRSWIVELCRNIFAHDQNLDSISGSIGENATGQWTSQEARSCNIPVKLIDESLAIRAWSRQTGGNYGTKVVALLRQAFGGHNLGKK